MLTATQATSQARQRKQADERGSCIQRSAFTYWTLPDKLTHARVHTHACTHMHTHTYAHAHMHTHTCTCIPTGNILGSASKYHWPNFNNIKRTLISHTACRVLKSLMAPYRLVSFKRSTWLNCPGKSCEKEQRCLRISGSLHRTGASTSNPRHHSQRERKIKMMKTWRSS